MAERYAATGWVLVLSSVLCILPFLIFCGYWHPVGTHAVDWISNWGGKYDNIDWWAQQLDWYRTTMGRYSSTALLSTVERWYRLPTLRLVVLLLHLLLGGALYYVISPLLRGSGIKWVATLTVLALYLSQLSNPYDSLYRLTGLFIYQTGLIGTLLLAGLLWRGRSYLAIPVIVWTVGTNEISLLHTGLLVGSYLLLTPACLRKPQGWALILTWGFCAAIALLAPGNWVRAELYSSAAFSTGALVGVTIASAGYLMLTWLSSTTLIPLLVLVACLGPRIELSLRQRILAVGAALVLPVLSLAPVLFATRGDSLPEGITDWQIIPTVLLLGLVALSLPRPRLSPAVGAALAVFVGMANLLGGLSVDRGREGGPRSPVERMVIASPPGAAWWQLATGKAQEYAQSVERQYEAILTCEAGTCFVPPVTELSTFLYAPSYDRRIKAHGDPWFGYLMNRPDVIVLSAPSKTRDR